MAFSVRVVGVGDAFTAQYYNACLLLESGGARVLIDAPPALARALRVATRGSGDEVGLDSIDHVIITHLHGDHVGGLEQLLFYRRFVTVLDHAPTSRQRLVASLVAAARELLVRTVAEGVETAEEGAACMRAGFSHAQGYHFGRPAPVEKMG